MSLESIKNAISKKLDLDKLPDEIIISTMTFTCKIDSDLKFNCENIAKFVSLQHGKICGTIYGVQGDIKTNRTILKEKPKKNKKKRSFFNQVTLKIEIPSKTQPINVKLFQNGSIQMTGCKSITNIVEALHAIFNELCDKKFVSDITVFNVKHLISLRICMINSYFNMEFSIDLNKLYDILIQDECFCLYDSDKHAAINIKFEHKDKLVTVLVFETGNIIITGASSCDQILDAYEFINKKILSNFNRVIKYNNIDLEKILVNI